jgi:hypothetical protein
MDLPKTPNLPHGFVILFCRHGVKTHGKQAQSADGDELGLARGHPKVVKSPLRSNTRRTIGRD